MVQGRAAVLARLFLSGFLFLNSYPKFKKEALAPYWPTLLHYLLMKRFSQFLGMHSFENRSAVACHPLTHPINTTAPSRSSAFGSSAARRS
ncbi:hypothetical protein K0U00_03475, partial [Paenibacillus sepulcri]|nr:hypothetical protein [Paenibacillus sepulcri]